MRRRLVREPFAQVALVDPRGESQLRDRHRPLGVQRFVEPQRIADMNQRNAGGASEVAEHLTHELAQLIHVDIGHDCLPLDCDPGVDEYFTAITGQARI